MIYYFTASDKKARENLNITIYNKINLGKYKEFLSEEELEELDKIDCLNGCYMWGAVPGLNNLPRWEKVKPKDIILGYSEKKFICFSEISYKMNNERLANAIWGNTSGVTWQYNIVFKNINYIDITVEKFNSFFGYNNNYTPRGFNNIREDLCDKIINLYGDIYNIIDILNDKEIDSINTKITKTENLDYEDIISNMSDKEFKEYLLTFNNSASLESVNKCVKVRKYNKNLIDKLKARANYRCQICGEGNKYNVSVVEAHHIEKFSLTQNNKPENIIILCPNHHRYIHKTKAIIDVKNKTIDFKNGEMVKFNPL